MVLHCVCVTERDPIITALGKWQTWCTVTLYKMFIIIILYMFRATLCSSSRRRIVLIVWISAHRTITYREFLLNMHTGRSLTDSSFSTCTPDDHLQTVRSQPAHRTITYRQFVLNLHTGRSLRDSSFKTCTPDGHLQTVLYQMLY